LFIADAMLRHPCFARIARLTATLALAAGCAAGQAAVDFEDDEDSGALMGDLLFHADLMSTLDSLCPVRGRGVATPRDWQSLVRALPARARTPELRELSRKLSSTAARAMVRGSGGCGSRDFSRAYEQTRTELELLLEQWARASV
jgi:hypothetical protein